MIHSFGDSFTYGQCILPGVSSDRLNTTFTTILAEHYKTPCRNYGIPGIGYHDILNIVTAQMGNIKEGDIVLIGGTTNSRLLMPSLNNDHRFRKLRYSNTKLGFREPGCHPMTTSTLVWDWESSDEKNLNTLQSILPSELPRATAMNVVKAYKTILEEINFRYDEYFHTYYQDWILSFFQYFEKKGVKCITWDWDWWGYIREQVPQTCICTHWNEEHHRLFSKYLIEGLDSNVRLMRKGVYNHKKLNTL